MVCHNYSHKTFSDLAASEARIANSIITWERRLKISTGKQPPAAGVSHPMSRHPMSSKINSCQQAAPDWMMPLYFSVLWGVGLFGVLEVDVLPVKALIIGSIAMASVGLDRLFGKQF